MANALDYISWRGDISLEADPMNEVDLLLFAMLSTPGYEGILPNESEMRLSEVADKYFQLHPGDHKNQLGALQSELVLPTLRSMGSSKRFRSCLMVGASRKISEKKTEQFEAVTLIPQENLLVISYRGTDDTLIGWKENFNLAIDNQVPAQKDALRYLEAVAAAYPQAGIITVGHSKGGNLAIYAAVNAKKDIRERILYSYGFDSPGFMEPFFQTEGYEQMKDRIVTVLSQHSLIGTLMIPAGRYLLVRSNVMGLMAHDCYHWEVLGPAFVKEKQLDNFSLAFSRALYEVLKSLSKVEKIVFIDEFFRILKENGASTVTDLMNVSALKSIGTLAKLATNPSVSNFFLQLLKNMDLSQKHVQELRDEVNKDFKRFTV